MLENKEKVYDLLIVGAGPAGYTASIYASRYKLSNAVVGDVFGGLTTTAHKICNYPSEESIQGFELTAKMQKNVQALGAELVFGKVVEVKKQDEIFCIKIENREDLKSKRIILATGSSHRSLGLENEKKFLGKGLSYCATCDGMFAKDKVASVVGGGNSAVTAALYLTDVAEKVYLIYRGEKLKAEPMWIDEIKKKKNLEIIYQANVIGLSGEEKLENITLDNKQEIKSDFIFIEIGSNPSSDIARQLGVLLDEKSYIKINSDQSTNVKNIWAAGDITNGSNNFRQITTACAEGAIAGESVFRSLMSS